MAQRLQKVYSQYIKGSAIFIYENCKTSVREYRLIVITESLFNQHMTLFLGVQDVPLKQVLFFSHCLRCVCWLVGVVFSSPFLHCD